MGVIAVLAAAVAACCGAAIGGVTIGDWQLPILAYGLCLLPGVAAAIRWPKRPPLRRPGWSVTVAGRDVELALLAFAGVAVLIGLAIVRANPSVRTVIALLVLGVIPLSLLWPRAGPLGASAVLSSAGLLSSGAALGDEPLLVAGFVAASAITLVATARVASGQLPRLGTAPAGRERQVLVAAAGLFALAMVFGLLASQITPKPPSSSLQDLSREGSRRTGGGKGSVSYQEEVDVSQPQAQAKGGRAVVLKVTTPLPSVLRTQTFDQWDGRRWHQSPPLAQEVPVEDGSMEDELPSELAGRPFSQQVKVEARYLDVLAAAPEPSQVVAAALLSVNRLETIRPRPPLTRGARYDVVSKRTFPTEAELRTSGSAVAEELTPYLAPGPTSERFRELAAEITAGAPSAYDAARAVDAWLRANVRVAKEPRPGPEGADVVDNVLFVDRAGTPPQLATAMVVLLRSAGVPARYGIGFLPGRRGLLSQDYVVRASDAHAWVEVGLDRVGWQRFDPSGRKDDAVRANSFWARLLRLLRQVAPFLLPLALVGVAFAVWWLLARRRRLLALPWVSRFWPRVTRAGAAWGRPRLAFETASEYTAALAGGALADPRLHRIGSLITAAAFSGREPPPEQRSEAERVLQEAVRAARAARRRRRLHFWRRGSPRTLPPPPP